MSYTMNIWEHVMTQRLGQGTKISENEFKIMPGRSTKEDLHTWAITGKILR